MLMVELNWILSGAGSVLLEHGLKAEANFVANAGVAVYPCPC